MKLIKLIIFLSLFFHTISFVPMTNTSKILAEMQAQNIASLLQGKLSHWTVTDRSGKLVRKIVIEYEDRNHH